MASYSESFMALIHDVRAMTATEYGFVAALLAGVVFVGFRFLGTSLSNEFTSIGNIGIGL